VDPPLTARWHMAVMFWMGARGPPLDPGTTAKHPMITSFNLTAGGRQHIDGALHCIVTHLSPLSTLNLASHAAHAIVRASRIFLTRVSCQARGISLNKITTVRPHMSVRLSPGPHTRPPRAAAATAALSRSPSRTAQSRPGC
jgi:hypothetical protein